MAYFSATPWKLESEANLWFGDAVPTGSSAIQSQFQLGDFLWITSNTGLPLIFRCYAAPSATNKDGLWQSTEGVQSITAVAAAYTALASDSTIVQSNGAGVAVTLPAPALVPGKSFTVKNNNGAATNTVVAAGGAAIDGGATLTLGAAYSSATLRSNGVKYFVMSSFSTVTVA